MSPKWLRLTIKLHDDVPVVLTVDGLSHHTSFAADLLTVASPLFSVD